MATKKANEPAKKPESVAAKKPANPKDKKVEEATTKKSPAQKTKPAEVSAAKTQSSAKAKEASKETLAVLPADSAKKAPVKKKNHRLGMPIKLLLLVIIIAATFMGVNDALQLNIIPGFELSSLGGAIGTCIPLFVLAVIGIELVLYFPKRKKKRTAVDNQLTNAVASAVDASKNRSVNLLFEEEDEHTVAVDPGPLNFDFSKYDKIDVQEIYGGVYLEVAKFDDKMRKLETQGASDLDIIQTTMTGNARFDDVLTTERSAKTLSAGDIAQYAMSKYNTVTIKKRGDINWTFKYGSKSFLIVREGKDGYKVSVKCFPDAILQLNKKFMALEDSNFPSGPIWFSFSELRNLPPKVIKWLIDTAHQIARLQQLKTDLLRVVKPSEELGINEAEIREYYKAGKTLFKSGKFTLVFQKDPAADLKVLLVDPVEGLDSKMFTKELYYKFIAKEDTKRRTQNDKVAPYAFEGLSVTILPDKAVSEEMQVTFFERIEAIIAK
jgi:predicted DNA-binding protein (MmcQ/YjbR family)